MRDMGDLYFTRLKRRIFISCLTAIIGVPCLGGLFWFILNVIVPGMENQDMASSPILIVMIVSTTILISMAIPLVISVVMINRRARQLDEVFVPLGFTGSMYMIFGRRYQRQDGNRRVDICVYRGPSMEMRISAPVDADFRVLKQDSIPSTLAGQLNKDGYVSKDPGLESLIFYPADLPWLPGFLEGGNAADAIRQLMLTGAEWAIFRRLEHHAGELQLHLSRSREWNSFPIEQSVISNWVRQLNILADELQAAGLPSVSAGKAEVQAKSRQGLNKFLVTVIIVMVIGFPLCATLVFIISLLAAGNG